jgi:hypothetical protein
MLINWGGGGESFEFAKRDPIKNTQFMLKINLKNLFILFPIID